MDNNIFFNSNKKYNPDIDIKLKQKKMRGKLLIT